MHDTSSRRGSGLRGRTPRTALPLYNNTDSYRNTSRGSPTRNGFRNSTPNQAASFHSPADTLLHHHSVDPMTSASARTTSVFAQPPTATIASDHYEYNRSAAWKPEPEPRLEDVHTVYRQPHYVPDATYHRRMTGSPSGNTTDYTALGLHFCALFSGIATTFLLFIGFLLDVQPLYIPGTLPTLPIQSTVSVNGVALTKLQYQYLIPGSTDERLPIAMTAYRAGWLYAATTFFCLLFLQRRQRRTYRKVPDVASLVLPTTTTTYANEYDDSVWQRIQTAVQRRWTTFWRTRRRRRRRQHRAAQRNAKPRME